MGQSANNGGRNASLDDKKERAAGRRHQRGLQAGSMREEYGEYFSKGRTGGAFGKDESLGRGRSKRR